MNDQKERREFALRPASRRSRGLRVTVEANTDDITGDLTISTDSGEQLFRGRVHRSVIACLDGIKEFDERADALAGSDVEHSQGSRFVARAGRRAVARVLRVTEIDELD
jgi:hypothetical protein